jgi:hypothetical protein
MRSDRGFSSSASAGDTARSGCPRAARALASLTSRTRLASHEPLRSPGKICLVGVALVHTLLVAGLVSSFDDALSKPFRAQDYTPHFYADVHIAARLLSHGRFWGYDPFWMAGYPEGQVTLVDNKLYCLFVMLAPPGWEALAFNAGVLSSLLAVPWVLYLAARLCGYERSSACGAALAGVIGTFSVPAAVVFWSGGGISFFLASLLAVPASLALARTVAQGWLFSRSGLLAVLAGVFTVFVHPVGAPMLAGGMLPALFSRGRRSFSRRLGDVALIGCALTLPLLPFLEASLWLRGPLRPIDPAAHGYFRGGMNQLLIDWSLLLFGSNGAFGAGGLLSIAVLAALGRRRGGEIGPGEIVDETLPRRVILTMAGGSALMVYVAPDLLGRIVLLQPYRFVIPLCFFLCLPAGRGIARGSSLMIRRRPLAWAAMALLTVPVGIAVRDLRPSLVLGHGFDPTETRLADFVRSATSEHDRILVESMVIPVPVTPGAERTILLRRFALLPLEAKREYLGYVATAPFMAHRYASFAAGKLFGRDLGTLSAADLGALLDRYDVSWIVGCAAGTIDRLRQLTALLAADEVLGDCEVFRVLAPARSRFLEGKGRARADLDRIDVDEASGERLVLKYHWLPNLSTVPPLPIEEVAQPGAPVGFIGVRLGGVRHFTIVLRGPLGLLSVMAAEEPRAARKPG